MKTNKKGPRGAGRTGIQSTGVEVVVSQKQTKKEGEKVKVQPLLAKPGSKLLQQSW